LCAIYSAFSFFVVVVLFFAVVVLFFAAGAFDSFWGADEGDLPLVFPIVWISIRERRLRCPFRRL
jgi:hypothetical protein